ncbi:rhodanese-like domain-containing protein [Methylocucumis oryzae]|uniref:Rhodanese domain protein n=1 Tax=Methylocucumis oryzae TaxID=1632867 RepID=A0A0F3IHX6_9GAMM|nr:rhodanese-like domain-containing protein [Methylocucumis oryzae]KJV06405.1 rhodanese domain protein [Methylocucumis oryzae]
MAIKQLSAQDLHAKLTNNEPVFLLDVREPPEFDYAHIEGSVLIPLNQVPKRLNEIATDAAIVVICHHGMRSQQAADYLAHVGYKNVANLQGGIDMWSRTVDDSVRRY